MKSPYILSVLLLLLTPALIFGQSKQDTLPSILDAPEGWIKERIPFPLSFARALPYQTGFEDLRFAPTWSDSTSDEFWTYAFVWQLEDNPKLRRKKLEKQIKAYYDGLMGVSNSLVLLSKKPKSNSGSSFMGKMRTKDAFFSQKALTLNLNVQVRYCKKTDRYFVLAHISPKGFGHEIWEKLVRVSVDVDCGE